jgi:hypothetical protein
MSVRQSAFRKLSVDARQQCSVPVSSVSSALNGSGWDLCLLCQQVGVAGRPRYRAVTPLRVNKVAGWERQ